MAKKRKFKESLTIDVMRSEINFAPFNPKLHSPEEITEMVDNFERVGFLGGIVWNKETGNLIDGHKRIMSMDYIQGYDGTKKNDYPVKVEMISMDLKTEKEQNLFFTFSATKTDDELMRRLIPDVEYCNTGLDDEQLQYYGVVFDAPDNYLEEEFIPEKGIDPDEVDKPEEPKQEQPENPETKISIVDDIDDVEDDEPKKTFKEPDNLNSYIMLTFSNDANKKAFLSRFGIGGNTTAIVGEEIAERIEVVK